MDCWVKAWAGDQEAQRTQAGRDHRNIPQSHCVTWLRWAPKGSSPGQCNPVAKAEGAAEVVQNAFRFSGAVAVQGLNWKHARWKKDHKVWTWEALKSISFWSLGPLSPEEFQLKGNAVRTNIN